MELLKQRVLTIILVLKQTVYIDRNSFFSRLIVIANKFAQISNLHFVNVNDLPQNDVDKVIDRSLTKSAPVLHDGDYFLSGTNTIMKYLLSQSERHICFLGGCDNKTTGLVNMWVDFCTFNVWPLYPHTVGQILGILSFLM